MPDLHHAIQIAARPAAVYPVISTARGWSQWWAADISEQDNVIELGFFNRSTIYRLRGQVDRPPVQSEWLCESGQEWEGTQLIFHLQPATSGTLLRFSHVGWQDRTDYFLACNTTWGELMYRVKAVAEGKSRGPLFMSDGLAN
jgi:uncharacterized protein YndB with AHSA1/START domain